MFEDRAQAGRLLGERLAAMRLQAPVVLALPRGGVPVAAQVAKALHAPLDLVLVRKIGAPGQPELAIAAVADHGDDEPTLVVDDETLRLSGATREDVLQAVPDHRRELLRRRALYLQGRPPLALGGRTAVVVDDGIATGTTLRAALAAVRRRQPSHVVLAVPVAPASALASLRDEVGEIVCLEAPRWFLAVGAHYRYFDQTTDEEVVSLMRDARGLST